MARTKRLRNKYVLAVVVLLLPAILQAQTYVLERSVIGAGGGSMSGATYAVTGTAGQSSPVGISTGSTYHTYHGFWHAVGGAELAAMVLAIELVNATTARLFWDPVALASAYDLYRSVTPYFSAGGSVWQTVSSPTTEYQFTAGIGNAVTNYYFRGIARNAASTSPESNLVGEFDVDLSGSTLRVKTSEQIQN